MKKILHSKILEISIWLYAIYFTSILIYELVIKDKKDDN
jgi:hypothetical protein